MEQLHGLLHTTVAARCSTLSSHSDISDTETLFTSDFASTPHVSTTEVTGKDPLRGAEFALDVPQPPLARSRSMVALDQLGSSNLLPQNGIVSRVRSYPTLRPGGDKHVRFTAGNDDGDDNDDDDGQDELAAFSSFDESAKELQRGARFSRSEGMASGASLHESDTLQVPPSSLKASSDFIQRAEDRYFGGKRYLDTGSLQEPFSGDSTPPNHRDPSLLAGEKPETARGSSTVPKKRPGTLQLASSPPSGNFLHVGEGSLTASINSEILGVSALNSEASTDCEPQGGIGSQDGHPLLKGNPRTKPNRVPRRSFSLNSKTATPTTTTTPTKEDESPISLPDLSHQTGSLVRFEDLSPGSIHTRPSTGYSHHPLQQHRLPSAIKSLPHLRHLSRRFPRSVLLHGGGGGGGGGGAELHGSSVFSSTHYGSIVSAAQSMTLSYTGSELDTATEMASSSPSVVSVPQDPTRW